VLLTYKERRGDLGLNTGYIRHLSRLQLLITIYSIALENFQLRSMALWLFETVRNLTRFSHTFAVYYARTDSSRSSVSLLVPWYRIPTADVLLPWFPN
jgi:hypothetical protein